MDTGNESSETKMTCLVINSKGDTEKVDDLLESGAENKGGREIKYRMNAEVNNKVPKNKEEKSA